MGAMDTAAPAQPLDELADRCLDLFRAVNTTAAAVTALVARTMTADPDGCAAALGAVAALLDATLPVSAVIDQLDA
jgi:hypothetical protein